MCIEEAPEFTIKNMTLIARLRGRVDLDEIAATFSEATFEPEKIKKVTFPLNAPKATLSIYANGKLVCMGVKSYEDGSKAIYTLVKMLEQHRIIPDTTLRLEPELRNVLATALMDFPLDLEYLSTQFEVANYDPTMFPALFIKMNGNATASLFGSGSIQLTGVDSVKRMSEFVAQVQKKIRLFSRRPNIAVAEQDGGE